MNSMWLSVMGRQLEDEEPGDRLIPRPVANTDSSVEDLVTPAQHEAREHQTNRPTH